MCRTVRINIPKLPSFDRFSPFALSIRRRGQWTDNAQEGLGVRITPSTTPSADDFRVNYSNVIQHEYFPGWVRGVLYLFLVRRNRMLRLRIGLNAGPEKCSSRHFSVEAARTCRRDSPGVFLFRNRERVWEVGPVVLPIISNRLENTAVFQSTGVQCFFTENW